MISSEKYLTYIRKIMIFKLQGELILDENKPTIAFVDKGDINGYSYIYGAARVIKEKLKDKYNIIEIGTGCNVKNNYYEVKRGETDNFLRKVDDPENYLKRNSDTLEKLLAESFKDLPVIDYIILGTDDFFRLPLTSYTNKRNSEILSKMENEFFDYVIEDESILHKIDVLNQKIINEWDRLVSPIAFSTKDYNLFNRAIDYINRQGKLKHKVIGFSIDPAIYTPFFILNNIPNDFYYFADDTRGTRNFKQLDIAQLQHIIYDNKFKPGLDDWEDVSTEKSGNFFFAGTIFQEKGSRKEMWDQYLRDVKSEKCSFYIPLRKNGIIKDHNKKSLRFENILKEHDDFVDLYEEIKTHNNYKGVLLPNELIEKTKHFKYGMVLRCVSINDSLNFRPVLYAYHDILPFLDFNYDPAYLQIPKHIQDKIVVKSAADIDERIEYFNNNDNERIEVINELRELFRIDDYINNPDKMINEQIKKIIPDF